MNSRWFSFILYSFIIPSFLISQVSQGGIPLSITRHLPADIEVISLPAVDVPSLLQEDSQRRQPAPLRFGYEFDVDLDLQNSGTWTQLENGDQVWRLQVNSQDAYALSFLFDDFWLPESGRLFIYTPDYEVIHGAFTYRNNKDYREFGTVPIAGDAAVLEYFAPADTDEPVIHLSRIIHAYRDVLGSEENDRSGACNNNVSCPEAEDWQAEVRSVAKLFVGAYLCSGALINNTSQDTTQYLLTAYHCVEGNGSPGNFSYMFNFQASQCYGSWGPTNQTVSGSVLRASSQDIYDSPDFALLELSEDIPDDYNVYYAGWSRESTLPQQPVGIHHPDGDIKKISFDYDQGTHYGQYKWNVVWDDGVTEPGSSGSPLFNADHLMVGDLSTGTSSCDNQNGGDQYGKIYRSWDYGSNSSMRLADWLDPDNLNLEILPGLDPFDDGSPYWGDLNEDEVLNVQDIIIVINIILGMIEPSEYQELAGDVNEDGITDILDVVTLVNLILSGG